MRYMNWKDLKAVMADLGCLHLRFRLRRKLRVLPCASSHHKIFDFAGTPERVKKGFRRYCALVVAVALLGWCSMTALAADAPLAVVNNLSEFIFGLIRAVGLILLGWGIV